MKVFFFLVETLVLGNIFILTALWRRQKSQRRLSQNHYKYMQKLYLQGHHQSLVSKHFITVWVK